MKKQRPNKKKIVTFTEKQVKQLKDQTNYRRLDDLSDEDIDYSDIPETDAQFWEGAEVKDPGPKRAISLRVDEDVLQWFKQRGGRYQRLMNQVLRHYMKVHRRS